MNLAVFFALSVLAPAGCSLDLFALAVAIGAFVLLQRFHWPIHVVLLLGAVLGLLSTVSTPLR